MIPTPYYDIKNIIWFLDQDLRIDFRAGLEIIYIRLWTINNSIDKENLKRIYISDAR